jgi:hypothetical protein
MSAPEKKPVRGENEETLSYNLRVKAWERRERKRKREQVETPDEAEAAEPEEEKEESLRDTVSKWFNRSEREIEKIEKE